MIYIMSPEKHRSVQSAEEAEEIINSVLESLDPDSVKIEADMVATNDRPAHPVFDENKNKIPDNPKPPTWSGPDNPQSFRPTPPPKTL